MSKVITDLNNFSRFVKPFKKTTKVCVGLCIHRDLTPETFYSLSLVQSLSEPQFFVRLEKGDAMIARSRSILASKFMKDNIEDVLLFIDDDILFKPGQALKIIADVIDNGLDIVGGCYVTKSETYPALQQKIFKGQEILLSPESNPVEVRYVSTGFMAISKKVFQAMIDSNVAPLCYPQEFYPFFATMCKEVDGKMRFLGEDWAFCERARELGFKVWLDPSIRVAHSGRYFYTVDDLTRPARKDGQAINYKEDFSE